MMGTAVDADKRLVSEHFIFRLDRTYYPFCHVGDNLIEEREEKYKTLVYETSGRKLVLEQDLFSVPRPEPHCEWPKAEIDNMLPRKPDKKYSPVLFDVFIGPKYPIQKENLKTTIVIPPHVPKTPVGPKKSTDSGIGDLSPRSLPYTRDDHLIEKQQSEENVASTTRDIS